MERLDARGPFRRLLQCYRQEMLRPELSIGNGEGDEEMDVRVMLGDEGGRVEEGTSLLVWTDR